jgi:catechol 2,3-dioxygenase-like lactoylglutathione lyase family enzyme
MKRLRSGISVLAVALLLAGAEACFGQLAAPNAGGVSMGHIHLTVPDVQKQAGIWELLGAEEKSSGRLRLYSLPGIDILLREGQPAAPSSATSVNHIGFSIRDYAAYKAKLESIGAKLVFDNEKDGQMIADLPGGVRLEFLTDASQERPIAFHHVHLAAADQGAVRDWYLKAFSAQAGERRGLPSALVPGGRIDVMGYRGERPRPSKGAAIDHIGFEVADMDAFAARMKRLGIEFDRPPARIEAIGLTVAFITDPVGTYIEVTEGLDDIK